jgi:hypothetical protein
MSDEIDYKAEYNRVSRDNFNMRCKLKWIAQCEMAQDPKYAQQVCADLARRALRGED